MKKLVALVLCSFMIVGCGNAETQHKGIAEKVATVSVEKKEINSEKRIEDKNKTEKSDSKTDDNKKDEQVNVDDKKQDVETTPKDKETSSNNSSQKPSAPTEQTKPADQTKPTEPEKPTVPEQPATPQYTESSYAEEVRNLINEIRVNNGLPALYPSAKLTEITQARADHQLEKFGHELPNGMQSGLWAEQQGIIPGGENVAMMSQSFTPQAVVDSWMESPGHQAPILSDHNSYMDIGVRFSNGRVYVVACWQQ